MRLKAIPALAFCVSVFVHGAVAAPANDACSLPQDLQREVGIKYPGAKLVTLQDLAEDDKGFYLKDHGNSCPGLVKVDFYGDGKPAIAFVLFTKGGVNKDTVLTVAHQVEGRWKMAVLDTAGPNAPVVWSQPPGDYQDVYGNKRIRATRPVIVFCRYEAWAILYAWTGRRATKIWIAD